MSQPQIIRDAIKKAKENGDEFFLGLPDRWYEKPGPKWRCEDGHVTTMYLKSERLGYNACLEGGCNKPVYLTFPEDQPTTATTEPQDEINEASS